MRETAQRSAWRSFQAFMLARPGLARLGVIALLFGVWEIAARFYVDKMFLSPPSSVFTSLQTVLMTPGVPNALRITFFELFIAFALSIAIGLSVGLMVGLNRFSHRSFMPIILLLYGTPQVTILPLFILYFGIGPASKIAFGVTHGMFPIMVTVIAGVQNIKPILLTSARSMGASRWHIFRWVIFPHMIPSFFSGMRLAMTGVLLGRAVGRTLRVDHRHRLFHHPVHPEFRSDQAARPHQHAGRHGDRAQRAGAARRGEVQPLAFGLAIWFPLMLHVIAGQSPRRRA